LDAELKALAIPLPEEVAVELAITMVLPPMLATVEVEEAEADDPLFPPILVVG
jgi:hypothetical protein